MKEIKSNMETEINSDRDLDQPVRDTDGEGGIEVDAAAEVDRNIDRSV